jgi:alkanesulfonate monooxygenase SsuD/methylene tetrahydromethanopterin reductase-like flavin-dependent oxidoreductase (luciferase family)
MEFNLFLPQMRLPFDKLVARARAAEDAGFVGITGMDHLVPPLADDQPMFEAMVANTWVAAHTERLRVGSLVLCDSFRHPAILARQAVSIDHASGGRFELGIGWGSWAEEFPKFGVDPLEPRDRVQRLRETLEILRALWAGEIVDYDGDFHHMKGARQEPTPLGRIPIVIGGTGPKTLALVRDFADWCNVQTGPRIDLEDLRSQIGDARVSVQEMVALVGPGDDRDEVAALASRRFGGVRPVVGTAAELVDRFGRLAEKGVERVYAWFTDFAAVETLAAFGEGVITPLRSRS